MSEPTLREYLEEGFNLGALAIVLFALTWFMMAM
jgi:hypothetical protein